MSSLESKKTLKMQIGKSIGNGLTTIRLAGNNNLLYKYTLGIHCNARGAFSTQNSINTYNKLGVYISKRYMGYVSPGTVLTISEVFYVKNMLSSITLIHRNNPIITTEGFIQAHQANILTGGKLYQHLLYVMYPRVAFNKEAIQKLFPMVKVEFTPNSHYSLADIINIISANSVSQHSVIQENVNLSVQITEVTKKASLEAWLNTNQMHPDFVITAKDKSWSRFFDEKKGEKWSPFSGHIILANDKDVEQKAKKMLLAQYTSLGKYNVQNNNALKSFQDELESIINNKHFTWELKSTIMNEFFIKNMAKLPANMTPSGVFKVKIPERWVTAIEQKNRLKMIANQNSFETISKTESSVVDSFTTQGSDAQKNLCESRGVSPKLKDMIQNLIDEQLKKSLNKFDDDTFLP